MDSGRDACRPLILDIAFHAELLLYWRLNPFGPKMSYYAQQQAPPPPPPQAYPPEQAPARGAPAGRLSDEGRRREFSAGSDRDEEPRRWILEGMLRRLVLLLGSGRVLLRVGGHAETSTSHDAVVICVTSMFE
ncbi:hypothetical protein MUK42_15700, partial [Musa troglodytarum]